MSTLSVTNINTANGTTDLTISTGNTFAVKLTFYANGSGMAFSNGTSTFFTINSTAISDSFDNFRSIPINTQTTSYQLAVVDNGRTVSTNAGITVNGAILGANQVYTILNNSNSNITITQGTGATMYLAGTANTGNRILAQKGFATIYCYAANTFLITGAGVL